jgi:hypothetical protein
VTLYSLLQYFRYRRKALSRHGVHSPFVFDLIEKSLRKKDGRPLKEKLAMYFGEHQIRWIDNPDPCQWMALFTQHLQGIQTEDIVIVKDIHRSQQHLQQWQLLKDGHEVRLSIDLFAYGLLFFSNAFKEKQHFIIKYPA